MIQRQDQNKYKDIIKKIQNDEHNNDNDNNHVLDTQNPFHFNNRILRRDYDFDSRDEELNWVANITNENEQFNRSLYQDEYERISKHKISGKRVFITSK